MKKLYFIFILLISTTSFAQVLTTEIPYPKETDSIVVIFDATQATNKTLLNYTGTLYAHTGVYTTLSPATWKYVIGNWGENTVQPALSRVDANKYMLKIGYPRNFYKISNSSEHITVLNFVFRSADGTKQTEDLHLTIYQSGLNINVVNPVVKNEFNDPLRSPSFVKNNDSVEIKITVDEVQTKVSSVKLSINNLEVASGSQASLNYIFKASEFNPGVNNLTVVATDTSNVSVTKNFVLFVNPPVVTEALPAGLKPGINYLSSTSATLVLYAPYKEFVYLLSGLTDWKVDANYMLKKFAPTADSVYWWITLNNLNSGQEVAFQYLVDGNIRVGDPYSEKILDPWNDQYISGSVYPNLMPYPSGKTVEAVTVLQTDQPQYQWNITNFNKPKKTDLVIYELLIRDFVSTHSYSTLIDTLSYLKNLGVNAIQLMPVMEFEGNESWGYNPSFHMALDKYYGAKNEFKRFIDSCHANGIAVILDIVLNHAFGQNPYVRLYWNGNQPAANSPFFNPIAKHPFNVGMDMNHESNATKYYIDRINEYWIKEYKIDGYRYDLSKGFTQRNSGGDVGYWGQFDQSRIDIITRMGNKIKEYDTTAFLILEHFADNNEETVLANRGFMFWGNLVHDYNEATMGYASNLSWGSYRARGWNSPNLVTYMESHDEERLMFKNLQYGASSGDYNIKKLPLALNRNKLGAAFFFTIPGPKMIWQFGELGYDISIDNPCRVCNKPILWNYYNDPGRMKLYKVYAALADLKINYPAFESDAFSTSLEGYAKRINIYHPSMDVTVIGNFALAPLDVVPQFSKTGKWYDYFSGDSMDVAYVSAPINLKAGEFRIYTTTKLPTPQGDILNSLREEESGLVDDYSLNQNYPNPFNPSTNIRFSLPMAGFTKLAVYNSLGEKVAELVNETLNAGIYTYNFDGSNLSSGMYFYKLETPDFSSVKKMMLIK